MEDLINHFNHQLEHSILSVRIGDEYFYLPQAFLDREDPDGIYYQTITLPDILATPNALGVFKVFSNAWKASKPEKKKVGN